MFCRYCIFYKLKVCGNSASSKSISTSFPTAFAHFMSLCPILAILAMHHNFSLLLHLLQWSVISDLWCYYCNGTPLQFSCLENPMDGGAWWAAVLGVAKSRTRLSDFTFSFYFHALEKEMATHSSVLAWRIPGTGKPGGLLSMGSHRVGHDWSDLA